MSYAADLAKTLNKDRKSALMGFAVNGVVTHPDHSYTMLHTPVKGMLREVDAIEKRYAPDYHASRDVQNHLREKRDQELEPVFTKAREHWEARKAEAQKAVEEARLFVERNRPNAIERFAVMHDSAKLAKAAQVQALFSTATTTELRALVAQATAERDTATAYALRQIITARGADLEEKDTAALIAQLNSVHRERFEAAVADYVATKVLAATVETDGPYLGALDGHFSRDLQRAMAGIYSALAYDDENGRAAVMRGGDEAVAAAMQKAGVEWPLVAMPGLPVAA